MKNSLIIMLLLLVVPFVSADMDVITYSTTNAFNMVSGNPTFALCQCQSATDTITITNTGVYASRYVLNHNLPEYVQATEYSFEILPGQSRTVYLTITVPCDAQLDETLIYEVTDVFQTTKQIQKSLAAGKCQNLESSLIAYIEGDSVAPCQAVDYTLVVANTGVFSETYEVEFGGEDYAQFFDAPYQSISIPPGLVGNVSATLQLDCDMYGDFAIPFGVKATKNDLIAAMEHQIKVRQDYDFSLDLETEDLCALEESSYVLEITNDADIDNNYTLSLNNPNFASLNQSLVEVLAGESKEVTVLLNPSDEDIGDALLKLGVSTQIGDISKNLTANITINRCHDIMATIVSDRDLDTCSGYYTFPVIVENKGTVDEYIQLSTNGSSFASLDAYEFELEAGEEREIALIVDAPYNEDSKETIVVTAQAQGVNIKSSDSIKTDLEDLYSCTLPKITGSTSAKYFESETEIKIKNVGKEAREFHVSLSGNDWLALDPAYEYITINPGQTVKVGLLLYQNDSQSAPHQSAVLHLATDGDRIYDLYFTVKLESKNIFVLGYEYSLAHPCQIASIALILAFIVLGIIALARKGRLVWNYKLFILLAGLWIVAIVITLGIYPIQPLYEDLPAPADNLDFVIGEGDSLLINASAFFEDPDGDNLTFSVDELENVSVDVDGGMILFTPDKDWFGDRRFRITADDGDDDTRSPRMTLTIIDRPEYGFMMFYERYCGPVNLVLLLLVMFVIYFVAARTNKQRSERKPQTNSKLVAKKAVQKKTAKKVAKKSSKKK